MISSLALIAIAAGSSIALAQPTGTTQPAATPATTAAPATAADATLWTVAADNLLLRSGDAYSFYPVAALKAGTVLKTDGERGGYLRVHYPAGLKALVKADEGSESGGKVKLTRPTTLQAFNMTAGPRASWNPLLERPLTPGTELSLVEAIKDDAGKVTHFAVQPPADARAYVDRQGVRRATPAEAEAFIKTAAPAPAPVAAPVVTPPASTVAPATATPTPTSTTTGTLTGTTTVTPPVPTTTMGDTPSTGGTPSSGTPTGTPLPATTVVSTPDAPPPAPVPAPVVIERPKATREQVLMEVFNRVKAQPAESAELDEAIAQFEGYKSATPAEKAARVDGYIDALRLRRDIRESRRSFQTTDARLATQRQQLAQAIAQLEQQRVYQIIGLLLPSAIYDGTTLPKLYRIQSPEPGSARTLGYIAPLPALNLESKLGQIVGVVGSTQWDEMLKAPTVNAQRVDVVSLSPIIGSPASAAEILQSVPAPTSVTPAESTSTPTSNAGTLPPGVTEVPVEPAPAPEPEKP